VIATAETTAGAVSQVVCTPAPTPGAPPANPAAKTRRKAAKTAAFGPVLINPVTMVGAPSYTSGVHRWNGALAILKPNPTSIIAAPTNSKAGYSIGPALIAALIFAMLVVPV